MDEVEGHRARRPYEIVKPLHEPGERSDTDDTESGVGSGGHRLDATPGEPEEQELWNGASAGGTLVVVEPTTVSPFVAWESFYVIIGSSAAALTGLQFVVVVLGAEARSMRSPEVGAFGTPTIVHFCAVLLIAAILSVPWRAVSSAGLALGASGAAGIVYTLIVIRR